MLSFRLPIRTLVIVLALSWTTSRAEIVLVEDFFADGSTSEGADPLDVNWVATGGSWQVVEDDLLNPLLPNRAAELFIQSPDPIAKDEYLSFRLPSPVNLEVGQSLQISFSLRFTDGQPRNDASRTGVSLAYHPNASRLSPWSDPGNQEYFLTTSFGQGGTLGSLRKSEGLQFLNSFHDLATNLQSVNLGNQPGELVFAVERLEVDTIRLRYALNGGPWQEAIDSDPSFWTFNQIHFRYRRATLEPAEKLRLSAVRVVLTDADTSVREPMEWWVSPDGDDSNTGDHPTGSFASINRALLWARPGDTVTIREGTYPERVQPVLSGLPGEPITIRAYVENNRPEKVRISGFNSFAAGEEGVGQWELHEGSIWKIQLPENLALPLGQNLVEVDEEVLIPARWPTANSPVDFDRRRMAEASAGSIDLDSRGSQSPYPQEDFYSGAYTVLTLPPFPADYLTGAHIDLCTGHNWWHKTGVITGNSADTLYFRFRFSETWNPTLDTPKHQDRFSLWGHLALLDSPGEFFLDVHGLNGPAHTLYVWLPDSGSPVERDWQILTREVGIQTADTAHIHFHNLQVRGGAVQTGPNSSDHIFDGVEVEFGAINRNLLVFRANNAVLLRGENHQFKNGRVAFTDGRSIMARDSGHHITNNVIEQSTSHLLSLDDLHSGQVDWNTAFNSGDTAVAMGAKASFIGYNHVYRAGMRITDIALMNTWNSGDMMGTEIAYNWAHTNLAPRDHSLSWWGGQGIRLDSGYAPRGCSHATIHHNVVWGTTSDSGITAWGLEEGMENYGDSRISVFHNTIDRDLVLGGSGSNAGTKVQRNIAIEFRNAGGSLTGTTLSENLFNQTSVAGNLVGPSDYISPVNRNYQLRPTSPAYHTGTPLPGITEDSSLAYLGAYNPDAAPWWPGARIRLRDLHDLHARIETDSLGNHWLKVDNAPRGRTFSASFSAQVGDLLLTGPEVIYDFTTNSATAQIPLPALPSPSSVNVALSLDGETFVAPATPLVEVSHPTANLSSPVITTTSSGTTVTLQFDPPPVHRATRFPLSFSGLLGHDLTRDAIPWVTDTSNWADLGMAEDGRDLRFYAADGVTPLRFHMESGAGLPNTLFWLLQSEDGESSSDIASFIDQSILYVAFGDGAELFADDPAVLTDSYPALASPQRILHLRATSLAQTFSDHEPVGNWPDLAPDDVPVVQSNLSAQPAYLSDQFAGLPSVIFDGQTDHLLVNGADGLGTGPGRFIIVYRNPNPGERFWQRLLSGRANEEMQDWVDGYAALVNNQNGTAVPQADPVIFDYNRQGEFSRENLTVGKRALSEAEWFKGEIAELIGFEGNFIGSERDGLYRYLRRKYNITPRPVASFDTSIALPRLRLWLGDLEIESFTLNEAGELQFTLPELDPESPSPSSWEITLILADGSTYHVPESIWTGSIPDVWRMEQFGPAAVWDESWHETLSGWQADPDNNGFPNLIEFAFGTNPLVAASKPEINFIREGNFLRFDFSPIRPETSVTLESSTDLKEWSTLGPYTGETWLPTAPGSLFWRLRFTLAEE